MRAWRMATMVLVLTAIWPPAAWPTILDTNVTETVVVASPDLASATGLAWAPDGSNRLFVIRQNGQIRIIKDGVLLPTPFATVSPLLVGPELGLLGITFDPDFPITRHLYVFASVSATEQQIIRYTAVGDLGIAPTVIVPGLPTLGINHNGGGIGIGPDGKLYWGVGDNGGGIGVNDDLTRLASKIGRANLDGTPVADNPFFDGAGPNADHIWARGVRNPFTLTFQPATGLLWVDVVGTLYEQIFIVRRGDHAGYNLYENNQPDGFLPPVIKYLTNGIDNRALAAASGAVRTGGVATFTTTVAHGFRLGEKITVSGVTDPSFNADVFVASVPSPTSFTAPSAGADAVSGAGNAATLAIGGCVTGGAFYDATEFPADYRGNYFFGDFNTSRIERVKLNPITNQVTSVDHFATVGNAVDIALGPDGALYYVGLTTNTVYRANYNVTAQGLVVSPTNVWIAEGQPALVMVRLATNPAQPITVSATRPAGDADISVGSGASLEFTSANWNVPQPVTMVAARDLDTTDDTATVVFSASGPGSEAVTIHARDDNALALMVTSTTLAIREGDSATFAVALSAQPSLEVQVAVGRASGDADVSVATGAALLFTATDWSTPRMVTVAAASDADGDADSATISVTASGMPPRTVEVTVADDDMPGSPVDAARSEGGISADGGMSTDAARSDGAISADAARSDRAISADAARSDGASAGTSGGSGCSCRAGGRASPRGGLGAFIALLALGGTLARRGRSRRIMSPLRWFRRRPSARPRARARRPDCG